MLTISFIELFKELTLDVGLDRSTVVYCAKRISREGIKFWTVTLPKLAKVVLRGLELGSFKAARDELRFTAIAWQGCSLRYFRSLLKQIFDLKTGDVLPNPSASALWALRQLLEYVYKLALDFDPAVLAKSEVAFEQTQKEVAELEFEHSWVERLRKNAETHYPRLFKGSPDTALAYGPRFGPGSFAGSERERVPFYVWKGQSDKHVGTCSTVFRPYSGYFKPYPGVPVNTVRRPMGLREVLGTPYKITYHDVRNESEVLFVPKDSRGPRVISKEPLHTIKPQMAFFAWAVDSLQKDTRGRVQFLDQTQNRDLARASSVSRVFSTLDLKDASDRVSHRLMCHIARYSPIMRFFLRNCRSETYKLPSGKTGKIASVAGMGSGLTFPLLGFIVHLSVCTQISKETRLPFEKVSRNVYVYGDDLVVPTAWVEMAKQGLVNSGLKVNTDKSFSNSLFRESCGGDYFAGIEVAPVRLKLNNAGLMSASAIGTVLTENHSSNFNSMLVGLVKHCAELRKSALFKTAEYLESRIRKRIPLPYVGEGSAVLGIYTDDEQLITKQGSVQDGVQAVEAVVAVPKTVNAWQCPFKYMASSIKDNSLVSWVEGSTPGTSHGVYSVPRRMRLIKRKVTLGDLAPAQVKLSSEARSYLAFLSKGKVK